MGYFLCKGTIFNTSKMKYSIVIKIQSKNLITKKANIKLCLCLKVIMLKYFFKINMLED